jgi:hypothetical protein
MSGNYLVEFLNRVYGNPVNGAVAITTCLFPHAPGLQVCSCSISQAAC